MRVRHEATSPTTGAHKKPKSRMCVFRAIRSHSLFCRKGFERQDWHEWALTVRSRLLRLLGKMIRQRSYAEVATQKNKRTAFLLLTKAFFIPIITNMTTMLVCVEVPVDGVPTRVLAKMPTVECGTGWQPYLALVAQLALIFYLPFATIFPAFATMDSDGKFDPEHLDVRFSVAIQLGQQVRTVRH